MPINRRIEQSFTNITAWMIDPQWGYAQLQQYVDDVAFAETHSLAELNYSERRAELMPKILSTDIQTGQLVTSNFNGFTGTGGVAVLNLKGVMRMDDGLSSNGMETLSKQIQQVYDHPGIIGAVLKIDSGGGDSLAAGLIRSVLQDAPKPIVGLATLMASGALYATLPLKHLMVVDKFSAVGSIGAYHQVDKKVAAFINENIDQIYAPSSKDKNAAWRAYANGDPSLYMKQAEELATLFGAEVVAARNLNPKQQQESLGGQMFLGPAAIENGLVTGYSNLSSAIKLVQQLAEQQNQINHDDMKFNASFLNAINTAFGTTFGENATIEEITTHVEQNTPQIMQLSADLADLRAAVAGFTTNQNTTATSLAAVIEQNTALEASCATFTSTIAAQETKIKSLQAQVADLTGIAIDEKKPGEGKVTDTMPGKNVSTFEAVLAEAATVTAESKY